MRCGTVIAAAVALLSATSLATTTPQQTIKDINHLSELTSVLQPVVSGLNLISALLSPPTLASEIQQIANTATQTATDIAQNPTVTNVNDAKSIQTEYSKFLILQQQLLTTLSGKSRSVTLGFTNFPIASALKDLEAAVDLLAKNLISTVPSQKVNIVPQQALFVSTIEQTIKQYSGLQGRGLGKRGYYQEFNA